jgi:hypothetical protein
LHATFCANIAGVVSQSNRPYSVVNVVDSLQRQGIKKTGAERALASLVSQGVVHKKEYGKSNIFILSQSNLELPDADATAAVDEEIKTLTARTAELDEAIGGLRVRSSELSSILSLDDARAEMERLSAVVSEKEAKLARLGDGSSLLTKEDKLKVETKYFGLLSAWKSRKKLVKNIADIVGESSGMKTKEFYEKVGVELDEDVGVNIVDYPHIDNPARAARNAQGGRPTKRLRT